MKFWAYSLVLFVSLLAAPAMAYERKNLDAEKQSEVQIYIYPKHHRYTFQDYLDDLQESTRVDRNQKDNPVYQLEARRHQQKYKPLNPIMLW